MLDVLTDGFRLAKEKLTGKATLTEEHLKDALEDVRRSLLQADVEYNVSKEFLSNVKEQVLGQAVELRAGKGAQKMRVTPADHFVQICHEQLEQLMGPVDNSFTFPTNRPAVIMMVGLQGSGKTTTTGKLTKYLIEKKKRKPMLVAADIYRPAAVEQLKVLGQKVGVPVFHLDNTDPLNICKKALAASFDQHCDTILLDTAGRLTIDEQLMRELDEIKASVHPDHIFLVCDAMMGQDAVTTAKSFNDRLDFSGIIMTKLDGDARGGAALSIKSVTGKPIKFLGIGESLDRLEEFRPEGLASRILGMGDIVGLMEDFERVAKEDQEQEALRMLQGKFNFNDFYEQISMIQKMGSLKDIAAKLPMQNLIPKDTQFDDHELVKIRSMIDSMTVEERLKPGVLNPSRVKRIANGAGRVDRDVQELIQKFSGMRKMMGMLGKNLGMLGKIPGLNKLAQLGDMRRMAQGLMQGGGLGGMQNLFSAPGVSTATQRRHFDRDKQKKLRKDARKARKKNRRK